MSTTNLKCNLLIFVVGCPGAGKGTLCKKLAADYNGSHLSIGDLLRASVQDEESNERAELTPYIRNGTLVPTNLLIKVLSRAIAQNVPDTQPFLLLDGFPRQLQQGIDVEAEIGSPSLVLLFNCDKETAARRFQNRKLPGRLDDDVEMFERRHSEYVVLNQEIVKYYRAMGKLVEVESSGETDTSYGNLLKKLMMRKEWTVQVGAE